MKTNSLKIFLAMALMAAGLSICSAQPIILKAGDKAPIVSGSDQDGKTWKLADDLGKKIVLIYFYPHDDTPVCTTEACGFRDNLADLKAANVEVIGVSFNTAARHKEFISKYHLNFPLLADTDGKIADAFGVRFPARNMAHRASFLIGLDGKIIHVTTAPDAEPHLSEMKAELAKLKTVSP
jgi:peroxiredoxin Q/BCP